MKVQVTQIWYQPHIRKSYGTLGCGIYLFILTYVVFKYSIQNRYCLYLDPFCFQIVCKRLIIKPIISECWIDIESKQDIDHCYNKIFYSKQILFTPWPILFSNRMQTFDHKTDHIRMPNWYWIKTRYWSLLQQNILFFIKSYSITLTFCIAKDCWTNHYPNHFMHKIDWSVEL